jgi:hypothetical protein
VASGRDGKLPDRTLERLARKLAGSALADSDSLLGTEVGNLRRFRDNGTDQAIVTPKRWARAVPAARGVGFVTYTCQQVLFLADGFGVSCPLTRVHRADLQDGRTQVLAFWRRESPLSIVCFEPSSRQGSARPAGFLDRLIAARDQERAKLPAAARAYLGRIDSIIWSQTPEQLWQRPSAPIGLEPGEAALLARQADEHSSEDGLDERAWNRLRILVREAHRGDQPSFVDTAYWTWTPPEFGTLGHNRTGLYLLYLLNTRVAEVLQTSEPTGVELHDLAARISPQFRQLLDAAGEDQAEQALRMAFDLSSPKLTGAQFGLTAAVILGVLMNDPGRELAAPRPSGPAAAGTA